MEIDNNHLTYCTNIHPGESWTATFESLKENLPKIREKLSHKGPLAIGLRVSNEASMELVQPDTLKSFKNWLEENGYYVFTFNGFPYGGFHRQRVKDEVHQPDWTTLERKGYTIRLFDIMSGLLPEGLDGGISTSPLSYRHWHKSTAETENVWQTSTKHLMEVVAHLHRLHQHTGKLMHLDIEPEPDGMIENAEETLALYQDWLLTLGAQHLEASLGVSNVKAQALILEHIRLCYDVCHFAVVYADHAKVLKEFREKGIQIGKFQLSAAVKVKLPSDSASKEKLENTLLPFAESTYLHQVVEKTGSATTKSFTDLPEALEQLQHSPSGGEWRIHFHVPIFLANYGNLESTQEDILQVLTLNGEHGYTTHLEVETYTWEVLPEDIHLTLSESIVRELQWVKTAL